ncbi:hypothetical protein BDN71DRAFT_1400985, partial [Pleurotus eryngii]
VPDDLTNICVKNFSPNLTSHVQPMANNASIIHCFKAHCQSKFISCAIDQYDSNIPAALICGIDQLEAMQLADTTWNEVMAETIYNYW